MRILKAGEKWGRLTVADVEWVYSRFEKPVWNYTLRCECGKEFEMRPHEFPGKTQMRDCGCGLSAEDGNVWSVSVSIPSNLYVSIETLARERTNGNKSKMIVALILEGLKNAEGIKIEKALTKRQRERATAKKIKADEKASWEG